MFSLRQSHFHLNKWRKINYSNFIQIYGTKIRTFAKMKWFVKHHHLNCIEENEKLPYVFVLLVAYTPSENNNNNRRRRQRRIMFLFVTKADAAIDMMKFLQKKGRKREEKTKKCSTIAFNETFWYSVGYILQLNLLRHIYIFAYRPTTSQHSTHQFS